MHFNTLELASLVYNNVLGFGKMANQTMEQAYPQLYGRYLEVYEYRCEGQHQAEAGLRFRSVMFSNPNLQTELWIA